MEITKKLIYSLADIMSVTGSEYRGREELLRALEGVFDEYYEDTTGTHVFIKRCGRENAPKLMLDAHFDEIGMIVSAIHEGGYLSVYDIEHLVALSRICSRKPGRDKCHTH